MPDESPAAGGGRVLLRLLDQPRLTLDAGKPMRLSARDGALLAYVALQAPVPRLRLAALLWPDRPLDDARNNLRQRVHRLQGQTGRRLFAPGDALALGADVVHDLADPLPALRADALALAGRLLGDLPDGGDDEFATWLAAERERWRARVRDALVQVATEREAEGRIAEALVAANRLAADEPLLEHGVRLLMRLHHRRGDRGAALDAFDRCAAALQAQLGAAPSDETLALADSIRRAGAASPPPVRALPLALRHPPRTVGREAAIAAADLRWQCGRVVLLTADAGLGKTRVFDDLCRRWGVQVVCRMAPGEPAAPLALLGHLARALLPRLPGGVDDETRAVLAWLAAPARPPRPPQPLGADRLTRVWRTALDAACRGGADAVAVDDLHWADAASLAVLLRLLPGGADAATGRWLLTCRPAEVPALLAAWLAGVPPADDPEVDLPPLDEPRLHAFVASLELPDIDAAAWSAALARHCGGRPLDVLQVLRALHERGELAQPQPPAALPVPRETVRQLSRRLAQLDPAAEQLAFVAALAGPDFDAELACRLTRRDAGELVGPWRRLEALGILDGAAVSHELVRQALLDALPAPLAPPLHRGIAEAMAAAGRSPARRARHWEAAGDWARAAHDSVQAADEAAAVGMQPEARDLLQRAADLFERAGDAPAAFDARWRAGRLTLACDSAAAAQQVAARVLAEAADDRRRCLALCPSAAVRTEQHDAAALDDADQALAAARDDPALGARAQLRRAAALQLVGRPHEALVLLDALDAPGSPLPAEEAPDAGDLRALVLAAVGQRRAALQRYVTGHRDALARHDLARAAERLGNAAVQLCYLCRPHDAIDACEQAVALSRRAGIEVGYVLVDEMTLAGAYQDVGRFDAALALAERVADELRTRGYVAWAINADNGLAGLFTVLGRPDLARKRLGDVPADAPTWARALRGASRARLDALGGRPSLAALREAMAMFDAGGAMPNPYALRRTELELARWSEPAAAIPMATTCREWATAHEHEAMWRQASMVAIDARVRAGAAGAAAHDADELRGRMAADGDEPQAYGFYLPELWCTLAAAWDAAGRRDDADAAAARGAAWVRERAARHVPPLFRDTFLTRNPTNRALLVRAAGVQPVSR